MSNSLEDERKAILERMSASRENYWHMFAHEDSHEHANEALAFPRSHTFKFLIRHPYSATLAALAAVAVLPRGSVRKAVKGSAAIAAGHGWYIGQPDEAIDNNAHPAPGDTHDALGQTPGPINSRGSKGR